MSGIYSAVEWLQGHLGMGSVGPLIAILLATFILGKFAGILLRALSRLVRQRADASRNLSTATVLRRTETWIILSVAIVQIVFVGFALYLWWDATKDEGNKNNALIGVSALAAIIIGGITGPLLRDLAFGASMMAEHWYGVGDLISVDAPKVRGVVESVSLRSTRIRGINGETYWVANSAIQGVSVARRGLLWIAMELFVNDAEKTEALIEKTNALLPTGSTLVAETLAITKVNERGKGVWHVTAVAGVAPGREWIIEDAATEIMKKLDSESKQPILITDPVHHFDDREAEQEIRRAVKNARKPQQKFDYAKLTPMQIRAKAKKTKRS